jgi:GTP-binding protein
VRIGEREFDWQPTAGEYVTGPRGSDARLEETSGRASAAQRLAARKARRVRSDDELLHMADDGTISTVANAQRPVLVAGSDDEDDTDE